MHSHAARFVHRVVASGRVSASSKPLPTVTLPRVHPHDFDRPFSSTGQKVLEKCHYTEPETYKCAHTPDTLHFRHVVQNWRVTGDPEPFPRPRRAQPTYTAAQSRWAREHRKRVLAALNGQTLTRPQDLSDNQVLLQEFCRSEPMYVQDVPPDDVTTVFFGHPKRETLYITLLRILSSPTDSLPTLASLIKFHREQPSGHRTARSYNLLLSLCLRHASFSTAEHLIKQMKRESIPPTLDTKKLILRLWTLTGRWDWAWRVCRQEYGGSPLPLFLWVEFFQGMKKGAFRRFGYRYRQNSNFRVLKEDESVLSRRFSLLMRNMPMMTEGERMDMPSRVVYLLVQTMLRFGWKEQAWRLTQEHLEHLPGHDISPKELRTARNIIHLHILPTQKPALRIPDFFERRNALEQLLNMHPSITPSSATLYLLISLIRRTRHCGALSSSIAHQFQMQWGKNMVDRRVARLLASLALKEGRIRTGMKLIRQEQETHRLHTLQTGAIQSSGPPSSYSKRPRLERIFRKRGLENRKWGLLRRAYRRRLAKKETCVTAVQ